MLNERGNKVGQRRTLQTFAQNRTEEETVALIRVRRASHDDRRVRVRVLAFQIATRIGLSRQRHALYASVRGRALDQILRIAVAHVAEAERLTLMFHARKGWPVFEHPPLAL